MSISIRVRPASLAADIHITGIFIHIAGIRIHIRPECLFTSLRNPYSHRPEYASYLAEIVAPLLIGSPLGQVSARIAAGDIGIEVGGVISQQTPTHQLFFF